MKIELGKQLTFKLIYILFKEVLTILQKFLQKI